ncbi:hypothetical protein DFR70_103165 [Nocardia tenerifensis]|uniref:Uncharacterized protein n=1 Tax=Nocardia tenerifensis TaxID=228006 RepID=A0A318KSG4_9NOCA|nr:hypothetical protein [Nocardia tenerifensis]PXX66417.1 hypothetical protein DFR70_103165 [Nocardia tenerifensis]
MDTASIAPSTAVSGARARAGLIGRTSPVLAVAGGLIVLQLALRGWVAGSGYFYWDDLILVGRAGRYPLLSADLLLHDHDGHFMPLAFAVAWAVTKAAPLVWAVPAISMLAGQLAVSLSVLRMLRLLLGVRWALLIPLTFFLFSPVTLPAFAWWSAALNALPLQFALAWVIGDALLLVRGGRVRYAVSGVVVLAVALLYFEKSVIIPFVAFAVATLAHYVDGRAAAVREVARRGMRLWVGSGLVLLCWLAAYLAVVGVGGPRHNPEDMRDWLPHATSLGLVPALVGGPWRWERWLPAAPWADPPGAAVLAAWLVLIAVVALTIHRRRRVWPVWLLAAGYVLVMQLPVAVVRGGPNTAAEIMQSLRYFADLGVTFAVVGALVLRASPRRASRASSRRVAIPLLTLFVVSSLCSTYTFVRSWSPSPTKTYLANVKSSLAHWDGAPLLEQEVPWDVLNPLAYPQNLTSRVLAPIAAPGTFADSTPHLRMITDTGAIVEAQVWWNRRILPGPEPGCGYRIRGDNPILIPLDGPMLDHEWTVQLNYLADEDAQLTVSMEHGRPVKVPLGQGLHTVFVRLIGSGSNLRLTSGDPRLSLCLGSGPVGVASYDN